MPGLYSRQRDIKLFNLYGRELIHNITGLFVLYYELVEDNPNVYGEIKEKRFYPPRKIHCIIQKEETETDADKGFLNIKNRITFSFQHLELKRIKILPKPGDIILFGIFVYEIETLVNPTLYPLTDNYFSYFKVSAHLTQIDPTNIKVVKVRNE